MFRVLRPSALSANPTTGSIRPKPFNQVRRRRMVNKIIVGTFIALF